MLVHLKTLGCRLNEAELESWAQAFQAAGHPITRELAIADIIVINSCAVTLDAARKSRQMIRRIYRENAKAKIVVSGCYATLNSSEVAALAGVDLVVSNKDKEQLVAQTLAGLNLGAMLAVPASSVASPLLSRGRQRAFIKVQDGCRYRCTFCIVTIARGEEISRPLAAIIDEINALQQQGINEVVLTGVHLGGYGHDINSDLTALIRAILKQTNIPRLRMGSLEPWELPARFFDLFDNPRLMPHLHLPLQSGSNSVLRRMARRCKTAEFAAIVKQARDRVKNFNISTDIIVGFPGETEQEWQQSIGFIESIGFGHIHIFTYSGQAGTKAATLPQQLDSAVKKQRSKQLHQLAERLKQQFIRQNIGHEYQVLWEGQKPAANNLSFGYTPNYLKVACKIAAGVTIENKIIKARLTATIDDHLRCELSGYRA